MNLKLLTLYNLILVSVLTAFSLYNSHSSQETLSALSFAPMALFFGLTTFRRRHPSPPASATLGTLRASESIGPAATLHPRPVQKETDTPKQKVDISDIDKRAFLKLVGATGFSFFLYSIINKRIQTPYFTGAPESGVTSLMDVAGNKINPPEKHPTDGYTISEVDDDIIAFYGFTNKAGAWYIMREDSNTGSIRYAKGSSDLANNWTNRKQLKYDYYNHVF